MSSRSISSAHLCPSSAVEQIVIHYFWHMLGAITLVYKFDLYPPQQHRRNFATKHSKLDTNVKIVELSNFVQMSESFAQ